MRSAASARDAVKAFEDVAQLISGDPGAGIADRQLEMRAGVAQFDLDGAIKSKLESIRQKVENDLFPHLPIDIRGLEQRQTVDVETQSCFLDGRTKDTRKLRGEG